MRFVVSGEGEHILNGNSYSLRKGSLFLLTPADFHAVIPKPENALKLFNVKFSDPILSDSLKNLLYSIDDTLMFDLDEGDFDKIYPEFERLYREIHLESVGKEIMIRGGIERIIIELIRLHNPTMKTNDQLKKTTIHKALSYIHQHFSEPLSLELLSKESNMSLSYFSEFFHKETGFSFRNYLLNYRLQMAFSLTMCSYLPIIEICYASGFNSLPHFHRAFKQKYGQSPSALRHQNENKCVTV
jgi:AraC-like DNA-binding protein